MTTETVRNPNDRNHFMVIRPVYERIRVFAGDTLIADTTKAIEIAETGKHPYPPILYIPKAALKQALEKADKTTHCPLKGNAHYYLLDGKEIAWAYDEPLPSAERIAGYLAFWPDKVRIERGD
ncbi:hypothetical protein HDIA_2812 [Hartmannibacter diazotrophicus]|uniref:DUF427 domain-containing protein n=1 Tax=Hartmannibacter diazotrophicus TaxID=1482074 RepID=A0A2C9D7X6_9HYPH|nr:DUF427 domain-containing protein [Hartmannibacter diazotrophicus]SON56353.1 hypothetical protein HDIA_2812 [Hartmannibacter diazotrophicus]